MILFLTGVGTGAAACFAAMLGESRRYLGQITSRQSISEARKIAKKALKETEIEK